LIHCVQFGRLLGQPEKSDVQRGRQRLRLASVWPVARSNSNQMVPHPR
jgi:hypothetical protein